ncbi:Ephrin type-A receptor 5 [Desmophyllum pertusum]|uniref:Ephrin type-A receptor 5 n=1 Tax=Desmophyllum pertusum TaxID=174260 RepID=A0A9W9YH51_9CNID|nr:Ephrin type-A receptor 5 [Desmophyllum pertusum]
MNLKVVNVTGKCAANFRIDSISIGCLIVSAVENGSEEMNSTGSVFVKLDGRKLFLNAKVCSLGYFKDKLGNAKCSKCPGKSFTDTTDRKSCKCDREFFRSPKENISNNCTGRPSAPRHLRNLLTNQTTVSLTWAHSHQRGRTDLFYEIECKILCREDQQSCSQDCGSQVLFLPRQGNLSLTRVVVTNLFSRTAYRFKVYAKNGVSAMAEKEGFPSRFAKLDVTTLESAPEQPMVTVKRIDSTSVTVSWILKNGNGGILYFLVTLPQIRRWLR